LLDYYLLSFSQQKIKDSLSEKKFSVKEKHTKILQKKSCFSSSRAGLGKSFFSHIEQQFS